MALKGTNPIACFSTAQHGPAVFTGAGEEDAVWCDGAAGAAK